jgi:DNA (cytosine-5)-methyltransferase 1
VAQKEGEKEMKVLSLFSGVGGFDLGLERAGMETVFQCEWDKHATSILERHWPDTPRWTDVSTLTGAYVLQHAPIIDVVAWGSPCQDLSVAGKRAGLGGERSGLFHEGIRIIKEIREITNGQYPRFSIWENVAGALSSPNGVDVCSSSLSSILQPQQDVPTRYYLSAKACAGILRRAERRGKNLPERLSRALQAVVTSQTPSQPSFTTDQPS